MSGPYAWYTLALAGKNPPIHTSPECGFFLYKGQNGMIPSSVYWESASVDPETGEILADQELRCEVGGVACDPEETWIWLAKRPIPREEYEQRQTALFSEVIKWLFSEMIK